MGNTRWGTRVASTLAVVLAVVLLGGCGSSEKKLDSKGVEAKIKLALTKSGSPGFPSVPGSGIPNTGGTPGRTIVSATCPSGVKQKKGTSFDCKLATKEGEKGTVTLTESDNKGQSFTYKAHLAGSNSTTDLSGNF